MAALFEEFPELADREITFEELLSALRAMERDGKIVVKRWPVSEHDFLEIVVLDPGRMAN